MAHLTANQTLHISTKYHQLRKWQHPGARCKDILHGDEWECTSYPWIDPEHPICILVKVWRSGDLKAITVNALALEPIIGEQSGVLG